MNDHHHRPDISGLRAIAVLSVIFYHLDVSAFRGGYIGVDIFFVISGYLISRQIVSALIKGTFSLREFYQRRAKRIVPALLTVVGVFTCLGCVLLAPRELEVYCVQAIASITSISNVFFWLRTNYFAPHAALRPLLMTWSLGVEEQFYLVLPLLLRSLWQRWKSRTIACLAGLSLASFIVSCLIVIKYPAAAFFLLPSRWWELGLGTLLGTYEAQTGRSGNGLQSRVANEGAAAVGLLMIVASLLCFNSKTLFPGASAIIPCAGSSLLLSSSQSWINRNLLAQRPLAAIGLISYSLYLWHWPVLSFAHYCSADALGYGVKVVLLGLMLVLATLTYFLIEQPFRRQNPSSRTLLRYALASIGCGVLPGAVLAMHGWPSRYPAAYTIEREAHEPPLDTCTVQNYETLPSLNHRCVPQGEGPTVAIVGDSHAASLDRYLRPSLEASGWSVDEFTKSSCPPLDDVAPGGRGADSCIAFNERVITELVRSRSIKDVILAGDFTSLFPPSMEGGRYVSKGRAEDATNLEESWQNVGNGLASIVGRLARSGKKVYIAVDSPTLDFNPLLVALSDSIPARHEIQSALLGHKTGVGEIPHIKSESTSRMEKLARQVASSQHASILDLYDSLCSDSACRYAADGRPFFEDNHHLTTRGGECALGIEGAEQLGLDTHVIQADCDSETGRDLLSRAIDIAQ